MIRKSKFVNGVVLGFVFLIPFIPPPTSLGPAKFLAPASMLFVAAVLIMLGLTERRRSGQVSRNSAGLGMVVLLVLLFHGVRIFYQHEMSEAPYWVSRGLFWITGLILLAWLGNSDDITPEILLERFFWGVVALSVLVIFVGFTGVTWFGGVRPSRTYGVKMPFYKTSGIPRSFGEFGIMASTAWAFFLVYHRRFRLFKRAAIAGVLLLAILIAQSRNVYLSIVVVTAAYVVLTNMPNRSVFARVILTCAFFMPFIIDFALPWIGSLPIGEALIGEGVFEKNVYSRGVQHEIALNLIMEQPSRTLFGYSHAEWLRWMGELEDKEHVIHNHFISLILYMGLLPGGFALLALYVIPMYRMIRYADWQSPENMAVYLAVTGCVLSLGFYEGWFSPAYVIVVVSAWMLSRPKMKESSQSVYPNDVATGSTTSQQRRWRSSDQTL